MRASPTDTGGGDMTSETPDRSPFELKVPFRDPFRLKLFGMMRRSLERFFLLDQLDQVYRGALAQGPGGDFGDAVMKSLGVTMEVSPADVERIPKEGPVLVVANHPFGGADGIVLLALLRKIRPDVKLIGNHLMRRIPELHEFSIFVDPYGGEGAARANLKPMKECVRWLRAGHLLLVFPSGDVSRLQLTDKQVSDPRWSATIAGMIRMAECPVVPVFVEGRNSDMFQVLGLLHPRFRTAMLPREFMQKRGGTIGLRVGSLIPFSRVKDLGDGEMIDYLRLRTYILRSRGSPDAVRGASGPQMPVAAPLHAESIAQDVWMLPPEACMLESDDLAVYCAPAAQIPRLLHEIGRLREVTFRAAGEGTGREIDLDRFDHHYHHLFVWNRKKNELVGAYRIGRTDEILASHGKKGLYTSTLFRYSRKLLDSLGPSLELGRSFVRPEYQRSYSPLLLLWKGIGAVISRDPRYRHMIGPVSINNEYQSLSRQMMLHFLRANNVDTRWARLVKPRNPPSRKAKGERWNPEVFRRIVKNPEEVSELIAEIEKDRKGVPILLKQYLRLGGKLLGFNVDPEFSDVLDGFIWVDLLGIDEKILGRFLGRKGAAAFRAFHGHGPAPA
jgi:putative hemolysin